MSIVVDLGSVSPETRIAGCEASVAEFLRVLIDASTVHALRLICDASDGEGVPRWRAALSDAGELPGEAPEPTPISGYVLPGERFGPIARNLVREHARAALDPRMLVAFSQTADGSVARVRLQYVDGVEAAADWQPEGHAAAAWVAHLLDEYARSEQAATDHDDSRVPRKPGGSRMRLALVSPMPPDRTGVAEETRANLPLLTRYYDVEIVVRAPDTVAIEDAHGLPVRDVVWFERHAHEFDRIVYHFGNSGWHAHMFGLLERFPGTVILHDPMLGEVHDTLEHIDPRSHAWTRAVYRSHGLTALRAVLDAGRKQALGSLACSAGVVAGADGVVVNSRYAARMLRRAYGPDFRLAVSSLPRTPQQTQAGRTAARRRLGLLPDDYLVCSFGLIAPTKAVMTLIRAWAASKMNSDPKARLVLVGGNDEGSYGVEVSEALAKLPRAHLTGFSERTMYHDFLRAADCAVQLRIASRGESSGAMLDVMAHGIPLLTNAHGFAGELPRSVVHMLPEQVSEGMLAGALDEVRDDVARRVALGVASLEHVRVALDPCRIAGEHVRAIERFARTGPHALRRRTMTALRGAATRDPVSLEHLARLVEENAPPLGAPQLLIDVTALARHDLRSGIQRVVRSVLSELLAGAAPGWRVEPVGLRDGRYWYEGAFAARLLGLPGGALSDAPVRVSAGDVFVGADLVTRGVHLHEQRFASWRKRGVRVVFVVYDLLPVRAPRFFPPVDADFFRKWLDTIVRVSDRLACISRSVAEDLEKWCGESQIPGVAAPEIAWFHLGADIEASVPSSGLPDEAERLLECLRTGTSILMVSVVEPRKGHAQALAAFEALWARGSDAKLVVVGREGWMVEELAARMRAHPEAGRRLIWLETVSDELLQRIYGACSALLMASEGEGYGLPLIEAAAHRLPLIVRDLPVFREVAQESAYYFGASNQDDLARALEAWFVLRSEGRIPRPEGVRYIGWKEATAALLDAAGIQVGASGAFTTRRGECELARAGPA